MARNYKDAPTFNIAHFGFRRKPFQGSGVDFLSACPGYDEAYAQLLDGIRNNRGLILLMGATGTGKTLLLNNLMHDPSVGLNAILCEPFTTFDELLASVCERLGLYAAGSSRSQALKVLKEYVGTHLGDSVVLLIDAADGMDADTLRHVINLSRLGARHGQRIRIVLAGSLALLTHLDRIRVANPIVGGALTVRLEPLNLNRLASFIKKQMELAGGQSDLFPLAAITRVAVHSQGIPGKANALCERALWIAEMAGEHHVSHDRVDEAARDLSLPTPSALLEKTVDLPTIPRFKTPVLPLASVSAPATKSPVRVASPLKGGLLALAGLAVVLLAAGVYLLPQRQEPSGPPESASPAPIASAEAVEPATPVPPPIASIRAPTEAPTSALSAPAAEPAPASRLDAGTIESPPATSKPGNIATGTLQSPVSPSIADFLRGGERMMEQGDMASARLFYEAALRAGHQAAATAVGKTYDPVVIARLGLKGVLADPLKAAEWYRKAEQAGDVEAGERLAALRDWWAGSPPLAGEQAMRLQRLLQP